MATQTSGAIAAIDPDVYAAQAAEESFVDALTVITRVPAMAVDA